MNLIEENGILRDNLAAAQATIVDLQTQLANALSHLNRISRPHRQPQSEETKRRISAALKGKPKTEAHRRNMSAAMKGKPRPNSGSKTGRKLTDDQVVAILTHLRDTKLTMKEIGKRCGAPAYSVSDIKRRNVYLDVITEFEKEKP
jgi:hypothetical protein